MQRVLCVTRPSFVGQRHIQLELALFQVAARNVEWAVHLALSFVLETLALKLMDYRITLLRLLLLILHTRTYI